MSYPGVKLKGSSWFTRLQSGFQVWDVSERRLVDGSDKGNKIQLHAALAKVPPISFAKMLKMLFSRAECRPDS